MHFYAVVAVIALSSAVAACGTFADDAWWQYRSESVAAHAVLAPNRGGPRCACGKDNSQLSRTLGNPHPDQAMMKINGGAERFIQTSSRE